MAQVGDDHFLDESDLMQDNDVPFLGDHNKIITGKDVWMGWVM